MKKCLAFALLGLPLCASAQSFCTRDAAIDPEFPAGLRGAYSIVGKDPAGNSYAGMLTLRYREHTYALTRTVNGTAIHGDAWIERCGPDKITTLVARYYGKPATELYCALGMDGDNYYRITCRTRHTGGTKNGLEAWFQGQ